MRAMMNDQLQYVRTGWRLRVLVPKHLWQAGRPRSLTWPTGIRCDKSDKAGLNKAREAAAAKLIEFREKIALWERAGTDDDEPMQRYDWPPTPWGPGRQFVGYPPPPGSWERYNRAMAAYNAPDTATEVVASEDVIKAWIDERRQDRRDPEARAIANKRSKLARMFGFLAGETKLSRLSQQDITRLLASGNIAAIEANDLKRYRRHLLPLGIGFDHLADITAMFVVAHRNGLIPTNPAAEIELPAQQHNTRDQFTPEEQKTLLAASRTACALVRWCTWIAGFSGSTTKELVNLQTTDIYIEDGVWIFDLHPPVGRNMKTAYRPRKIPLRSTVIREGFLEYVQGLPVGPLFPDLVGDRRETKASDMLNSFIRKNGIGWKIVDGARVKDPLKVFYSWRHSVASALESVPGVTRDRARFVVGHAPIDVHAKNYVHPTISELVLAIEGLPDPLA